MMNKIQIRHEKVEQWTCGLIMAVALTALTGWGLGTLLLASWMKDAIPMAPSTALIFFVFSLMMFMGTLRPGSKTVRHWMIIALMPVIIYCFWVIFSSVVPLTLSEITANRPGANFPAALNGSMSPLTAMAFVSAFLAFLISTFFVGNRSWMLLSDLFLGIVSFLGGTTLIGYLYGTPLLYGGGITPMALPTAFSFFWLTIAIIMRNGERSPLFCMILGKTMHSQLIRIFLPPVVLFVLVKGWISMKFNALFSSVNPAVIHSAEAIIGLSVVAFLTVIVAHRHGRDLEAAQRATEESELWYRSIFEGVREGILVADARTKKFSFANAAICGMFGYTREEMLRLGVMDIHPKESLADVVAEFEAQARGEKVMALQLPCLSRDGRIFYVDIKTSILTLNNRVCLVGFFTDVSENKLIAEYREMSREVLQMLNEPGDLRGSIQKVLGVLKTRTGFDAVGIRLQDGEDFPYFVQEGFSGAFLLEENTLIERAKDGGLCRNRDGSARLECPCGLVLLGQTEKAGVLYTPAGSFWTNDSFLLLDIPPDKDSRPHPRNRCIHQGYASVALVPIKEQDKIVGLIHLNNRSKGSFTLKSVELLEWIGVYIGTALMRKNAEERDRKHMKELEVFYNAAVGREERIIALKKELDAWEKGLKKHKNDDHNE